MNDATDPVGAAPWLAPDAASEAAGPTGETSETAEVEFDGRRWEVPPDWLAPPEASGEPPLAAPDGPEPAAPDVSAIDARLAAFEGIDWRGWAAVEPEAAGAAFQAMAELSTARDQAQAAEALQRDLRLQAAHAELSRDIDGWSPELAADLAAYGQARGFTHEELAAVEDPREIKILHLAMLGEQALARQAHEQRFGRFRPPTQVGGRGHPGQPPSDRNSVEAWMQARRTQLRKKARS